MIEIASMRWKYLRETKTKFYDETRNTALSDYLEYIFHNNEFIYDKPIPKDIILSRNSDAKCRKFRPDARCEELSLIVEFDGVDHYQDPQVILNDIHRDGYMRSLGYTVVRIPYWVQLTREVVDCLFAEFKSHMTISSSDPLCTLTCSFHDADKDSFNISISVGAMCRQGQFVFIARVQSLPIITQYEIYEDIKWCCDHSTVDPECIIPAIVLHDWKIESLTLPFGTDIDSLNVREHLLFHNYYSGVSYIQGIKLFEINVYEYKQYIKMLGQFDPLSNINTNTKLIESIGSCIDTLINSNTDTFTLLGVAMHPDHHRYGTYINGFSCIHSEANDNMIHELYTCYETLLEDSLYIVDDADSGCYYVWIC